MPNNDLLPTETIPSSLSYKNHTITITPQWHFKITGLLFDEKLNHTFSNIREAKNEIDARIETAQKQKKNDVLMALKAVRDTDGELVTIRGIHMNTGKLLGSDGDVYPQVPWIIAAAKKIAVNNAETRRLVQSIRPFRISATRAYQRIKAEDYERMVNALETEYNKAYQSALEQEPK